MKEGDTDEPELAMNDLIDLMTESKRHQQQRRSSYSGGISQLRTSNGFRRISMANISLLSDNQPTKGNLLVPTQIQVRRLSSNCGASYQSHPSRENFHEAFDAMDMLTEKEISFRMQPQSEQDRARLMESIYWLASHVPICLLDRLVEEVRIKRRIAEGSLIVPEDSRKESDCDHSESESMVSELSEADMMNGSATKRQERPKTDTGNDQDFDSDSDNPTPNRRRHPLHLANHALSSGEFNTNGKFGFTQNDCISNENQSDTKGKDPYADSALATGGIPRKIKLENIKACRAGNLISVQTSTDQSQSFPHFNRQHSRGPSRSPLPDHCDQLEAHSARGSIRKGIMSIMKLDKKSWGFSFDPQNTCTVRSLSSRCSSTSIDEQHELALKALGIGANSRHSPFFIDPFPFDSDDEKQIQLRQGKIQQPHRRSAAMQRNESPQTWPESSNLTSGEQSSELRQSSLPYSLPRQSALLFVDISGFTKLSTLLDPESLSNAINFYFQRVVNEIISHGGDVLKFAGDAIYAEWAASSLDDIDTNGNRRLPLLKLEDCVFAAASCGAKIVAECSDFPIFGTSGEGQIASLNVHCGLGAGKVVGIHIGDEESRREFVILGHPLNQLTDASQNANLGELVASPEALALLGERCTFDTSLSQTTGRAVIARRTFKSFTPLPHMGSSIRVSINMLNQLRSKIDKEFSFAELTLYRKLIALYAHPVILANDSAALEMPRFSNVAEERHREEAELRSVYVMFITPLIGIDISDDDAENNALYSLLNDIMNLTTRELARFSGHLRQFIIDDKGVVLIATFGLRGSSFPNMVAERALPCTIVLQNALVTELGVQNQIGATIGNAYCGVVGGISRHEYAVMGPSVNLAARLMSSPKNPGILVDNGVRMMADKSYGFNALSPVKAKGYLEPVPIFEPLSPLERSWGRVQPNFVGRKTEIKQIMSCAREMAMANCATRMIMIEGDSGIGKSTLMVHAIEHVRRGLRASRRRLIVSKSVGKEGDQLVPFGMFSAILFDVLQFCKAWASDERSLASRGGKSIHSLNSLDWESLSAGSQMTTGTMGTHSSRKRERLSFICRELNAPPEFAELIGHHLLGIDIPTTKKQQVRRLGGMKSLISFMTRAFLRCIQDASLVVVALDDIQYMDEMSWKVVQEIFETTENIMLISPTRGDAEFTLFIDRDFWGKLNDVHEMNMRFSLIRLDKLYEEEILHMIAKTLGLQTKDVSSKLHHNVLTQSQGMPLFANEILESMKRRSCPTNSDDIMPPNDTSAIASVGELILHRIDSFDAPVRNVLNIGAVLGSTFELVELVAVLREIVGGDGSDQILLILKTREALELAVDEGILFFIRNDEELADTDNIGEQDMIASEGIDDNDEKSVPSRVSSFSFAFCHEIWRSTILKLMLGSRKRDIHRTIASTLEAQLGEDMNDYLSRMKLFSHWKACGDQSKASTLAIDIGTTYENLGMHNQSIRLYEDALSLWSAQNSSGEKVVGNFTQNCLDSLSGDGIETIVKLFNAIARALATIHQGKESVDSYRHALGVLKHAKGAKDIIDRSCLFPIFSGLFVAIKFGQIEQDEACSYERELIAQFVSETENHGDPVHVARAIAMQAEVLGRLGMFEGALEVFEKLREFYVPILYSRKLCQAYGSDRAAQCFGLAAIWLMALGQQEKALQSCQFVISQLIPQMDERNVHNTCLILYPILWVYKEYGYAARARQIFDCCVVQKFHNHYAEGATTACLPIYEPILILLDLAAGEVENETFQEYLHWAHDEENLRFGSGMNNAMGYCGRCPDSISAEICLLLAKGLEPGEDQLHLIQFGLDIILEVVSLTQKQKMIVALNQVLPVYKQLMALANGLIRDKD